jgi:hypothetical protein
MEIEVPYFFDINQNIFTYLNQGLSEFVNEKEISFKSGVIMQFMQCLSFNTYTEESKYLIKVRVVSCSQSELFTSAYFTDFHGDVLYLSKNILRENIDPDSIIYLSLALKVNKSITNLNLSGHSLGKTLCVLNI